MILTIVAASAVATAAQPAPEVVAAPAAAERAVIAYPPSHFAEAAPTPPMT